MLYGWNSFLATLSFFTRFYVPYNTSARPHLLYYPIVGFIIGIISAIPAYILQIFFPHITPYFSAFTYIALTAWCTKCLHWDALADIADGIGSRKTGTDVWAVIKDSAIGAFGTIAIVFASILYCITIAELCKNNSIVVLILTPMLSRYYAGALVLFMPPPPHIGLASYLYTKKPSSSSCLLIGMATLFAGYFLYSTGIFIIALIAILPCAYTITIAKRFGGANGDMYGTALILCELTIFSTTIFL